MPRPKIIVWISTALLVGVLHGALATEASAQPTPTRELDSPIRGDRYAERFSMVFGVGNPFQAHEMITPVIPAGKKLFLQSVSMQTALTHGQSPYHVTVTIFQGLARNPIAELYVDMNLQATWQQGGEPTRYFAGNRDINMVVHAGESFSVSFSRNGFQGLPRRNFSQVTFIGYFVDVDAATPPSE
jgi:hypothetical protein